MIARSVLTYAFVLSVTAAAPQAAMALALSDDAWRVTTGDVRVLCPLTVGGSFEGRTSELSGVLTATSTKPATLAGDLSVDLRKLDTGINLRNEHLRENYLEVSKAAGYEHAVLSGVTMPDADLATTEGKTRFTGQLRVHGVTKPVTGAAEIKRLSDKVKITAHLTVHLPDFEIAQPRYLGVGVKDDVQLTVTFVATKEGSSAKP